jgi:hypothetical protein
MAMVGLLVVRFRLIVNAKKPSSGAGVAAGAVDGLGS